jgi:hypothetical protein
LSIAVARLVAGAILDARDKSDLENIADGVIATAENLRDGKISAKAARIASAHFLATLDALSPPATPLTRRCSLLAFLVSEWADEFAYGSDLLLAIECKKLALGAINLVQTTMAREAGRTP